jgi:hypothetical protein
MSEPLQDSSHLNDDTELSRRILAALQDRHVPSLRNVKIEPQDGALFLRGQVHSFYAKQIAHHSARLLAGNIRVIDEISVIPPSALRDTLRTRPSVAASHFATVVVETARSLPIRMTG